MLTDIQRRQLDHLRLVVVDARNRTTNAIAETRATENTLGMPGPIDAGFLDEADRWLVGVVEILDSMIRHGSATAAESKD